MGIQEQNPSFQTLFPFRPTVIYCVILLMTNIDCKIVVFFSIIKIVFFAQSMHKACKPSLSHLSPVSHSIHSQCLLSKPKNQFINVFCPCLSLLLFQHREAKAGTNLFAFYFLHLHTTLNFYDCLKP